MQSFVKFLILLGLLILPDTAWAAEINKIRFGRQGENTRIVLDMSAPVEYSYQTLSDPPRLVLDMPSGTTFSGDIAADPTGRVTTIRYGSPNPQTERMVFDLSGVLDVKTHFILPPSRETRYYRLVMDVSKARAPPASNQPAAAPAVPAPSLPSTPAPLNLSTIEAPSSAPATVFNGPLPTLKPPHLSSEAPRIYTVVIDAGHGGGDPGGIGHGNIKEKHIVLSIAKTLKQQLERTGRYRVLLTRDSDYYIKLRERFQKARAMDADMFISLHADKINSPNVRGASVYTLSETASDKETARLAQQENNAGVVAGVDLAVEEEDVANILLDLARRETLNESKLFAELLVKSMDSHNVRHLNNPHRFAGFAVLKAPDIPSVLIEAGFLSNRSDARLLQSQDYQKQLAVTISHAVDQFFNRLERLNEE